MPATDDTARLRALEENARGDIDDTDSLPTVRDFPRESTRGTDSDSQPSNAALIESLDWLMSITTTVDKRMEKIEQELRDIKILLSEEPREEGKLGKAIDSFLAAIRRRFK